MEVLIPEDVDLPLDRSRPELFRGRNFLPMSADESEI